MKLFGKTTVDQAKDTGLALILILLLIAYFGKHYYLIPFAIGAIALTMIVPAIFKPLAVVWFGLSHLLGNIVSKIILTLIFILIVTPVGLIRKMFGADPMMLKLWKKDSGSVFLKRDHTFSIKDLEKPY